MKPGDLIEIEAYRAGPVYTGLVYKVEKVWNQKWSRNETRFWALWADGECSWVLELDNPRVISKKSS